MTAQPEDFLPVRPAEPEKNLRAVRAALVVPEDREAFDAGLRAVLDEVRVSLDLGALNDFVHRWWISACDSVRDPDGRRRMHARAGQVLAGGPAPRWEAVARDSRRPRERTVGVPTRPGTGR